MKVFDRLLEKKRYLAVLVISAIIIVACQRYGYAMDVSYLTGYQGLQSEFNSLYYRNFWYDRSHAGPNTNYVVEKSAQTASAVEFIDRVNFDPDYSSTYMPNLGASQTPVSVDLDYGTKVYGPWRVKVGEETAQHSNSTHSWTTTTSTYKEYQIIRYRCLWSMNLWLSGDYYEASPSDASTYRDAQLWIRLVPKSFLYFADTPDRVYFAPAKIQLLDAEWWSVDKNGKESRDSSISQYQDLIPEARGETLGIYYARGAEDVNLEESMLSYQGAMLDPSIFRGEYWTYVSLQVFRPYSYWNDMLHVTGWSYQFPSVKLDFEVYVFAVGEWTVKLSTDEVVPLETHDPQVVKTSPFQGLFDWLANSWATLASWAGNPFTQIGAGIFGLCAIAIVGLLVVYYLKGTNLLDKLFRRKTE